jgi:hypothetical protein
MVCGVGGLRLRMLIGSAHVMVVLPVRYRDPQGGILEGRAMHTYALPSLIIFLLIAMEVRLSMRCCHEVHNIVVLLTGV